MAGRSSPDMTVSEGIIKAGTEVTITYGTTEHQARVVGYIASTHAYLCDLGRELRAVKAEQVLRRVPKFNTVEEADAWMEGRA